MYRCGGMLKNRFIIVINIQAPSGYDFSFSSIQKNYYIFFIKFILQFNVNFNLNYRKKHTIFITKKTFFN